MIIFTKAPENGRVKTRMKPYLTDEECADLAECMLRDISRETADTGADIFMCYDAGSEGLRKLRKIFGRRPVYFPQEGSGLGERMDNALRKVLALGYSSCMLMGSDIPEVRTSELIDAFDALDNNDIVCGPSADGGYWLIGMHRPESSLLTGREYSHGHVLEELMQAASDEGLSCALASRHQDMDEPDDLRDFASRMRRDAYLRKSRTGRFVRDHMSISLIMPVYNEITTIDAMTDQLGRLKDDFEVIIVDGGSTDGTCEHIPDGFTLIHSGKGRAVQMNTGAAAATGDILFFVHCDSELPDEPAKEIRRVMARREAGCFGIAFHSGQFFMMTNRVISNLRAGVHRVMFGDQGIFMTRELFDLVGGFPEIPIMEDYQMSLTLREMGVRTGMARHRIYTSDRRYPRENIPKLRLMHRMYRLRRAYKRGVPIEQIAAEYRDVR